MSTLTRKENNPPDVMAAMSLRLSANLKDDIDDLAFSAGADTSAIVIELIQEFVDANRERINTFRKLADEPLAGLAHPTENKEEITNDI